MQGTAQHVPCATQRSCRMMMRMPLLLSLCAGIIAVSAGSAQGAPMRLLLPGTPTTFALPQISCA